MPGNSRNRFKYKEWIFQPLERKQGSYEFDCDDKHVSTFFTEDCFRYESLRLCKTYELMTEEILQEDLPPVAFISYCNDSIRIKNMVEELVDLPEAKPLKFYPAMKICWLGVHKKLQRTPDRPGSGGTGIDLINITKLLFASEENRTGCRIITVDAQNTERAVGLYKKTDFVFFNRNRTPETAPKDSLYPMFFDLTGDWEYDPNLLEPILF